MGDCILIKPDTTDTLDILKFAILAGGVFIAIFAGIGLTFFGLDVRKAHHSLADAEKEIRERVKKINQQVSEMAELRDKLEQLGAQVEGDLTLEPQLPRVANSEERTRIDLIREVIRTGTFAWTSIARIIRRTGLTRDQILDEVRKAADIDIGTGRNSKDFIFKFKLRPLE